MTDDEIRYYTYGAYDNEGHLIRGLTNVFAAAAGETGQQAAHKVLGALDEMAQAGSLKTPACAVYLWADRAVQPQRQQLDNIPHNGFPTGIAWRR